MSESWPTKKLGEVISFEKGKKMAVSKNKDGAMPYIGIDNLRTKTYSLYTYEKNGIRCEPKDVLLVWDGAYAGTVGIGMRGFVGSTIVKVLHDNSLNNHFLMYLLKFNELKIRSAAQGAAVPHLNKSFINNLKVSVPPLPIQYQIVKRLDAIRKAQELNERQISLADELFQSLLHKELSPRGNDWEVKRLADISSFQYGYTASATETGKYRFIRITDIDDGGNIRNDDTKYIDGPEKELEPYILNHGDLLIARTGATFGKILFFDLKEKSIFASYLIRLNIDKRVINSMFLWLFSRTKNYWSQATNLMIGSGQPQFNANKIKQLKIPLPPLKTQRRIVERLQTVQDYKKALLQQKQKLQELFESSLNRVMQGELMK